VNVMTEMTESVKERQQHMLENHTKHVKVAIMMNVIVKMNDISNIQEMNVVVVAAVVAEIDQ